MIAASIIPNLILFIVIGIAIKYKNKPVTTTINVYVDGKKREMS